MRVLSVTSELFPLIKTGGLADVAGALPIALAAEGVEVKSLLPGYKAVLDKLGPKAEHIIHLDDLFGGPADLISAQNDQLSVLLIDAPHLYGQDGNPYTDASGKDWPHNARRFAALSWVAAAIGKGRLKSWQPDVVHAHDWQAGLTPAYLALDEGPRPATVTTIHNIAFQGWFPSTMLGELRLPAKAYSMQGIEYYNGIGFLKAGLFYADRLTTVSPTYAREIRSEAYGMGLEGLLSGRADVLHGIVNGIDADVWNPASDPNLAAPYSNRKLAARSKNRSALRERMRLSDEAKGPLFCAVTRLTWQKGMDLLLAQLPGLESLDAQLALLGSGDSDLEAGFDHAAQTMPGRVSCVFGYDEPLSHLMQAGADAILIPSRFEPCGLTQLYGLRYGCVPIVSRVGGLADTVIDANDAALADKVATGLHVAPVDAATLRITMERATQLFANPAQWKSLQRRGMTREVGWKEPAKRYKALYADAIATANT